MLQRITSTFGLQPGINWLCNSIFYLVVHCTWQRRVTLQQQRKKFFNRHFLRYTNDILWFSQTFVMRGINGGSEICTRRTIINPTVCFLLPLRVKKKYLTCFPSISHHSLWGPKSFCWEVEATFLAWAPTPRQRMDAASAGSQEGVWIFYLAIGSYEEPPLGPPTGWGGVHSNTALFGVI